MNDLALTAHRVIDDSDFTKRERSLLHLIVRWSFDRNLEWASFETLDDLVKLTGIHKPDVSNDLNGLRNAGMIHIKMSRAMKFSPQLLAIRFLPHGALAPAALKIDATAAAEVCAKLERLNPFPDGFDAHGQKPLPLVTIEETVDNELAQNSRAAAQDVSESLTRSVSETLTSRPSPTVATSPARTRAPATCHVFSSATQSMRHDHGGDAPKVRIRIEDLTPAERDLFDQIVELTAVEGRVKHFADTWCVRIHEHSVAVFSAIGETRMAVQRRQIKRTIGGTLNWHFVNFRDGNLAKKLSTSEKRRGGEI